MNKSNNTERPMAIFRCSFSGCNASYQRKEHLRRHQTKHSQHQAFPCSNCDRKFARSDTLRRHAWQHHKIKEPSSRARQACQSCRATKSRCKGLPCTECVRRNIQCIFEDQHQDQDQDQDQDKGQIQTQNNNQQEKDLDPTPLSDKRDQYIKLFFEKFDPKWPFIHKISFNVRHETPLLVQSMVVLGMWASGESARSAAVEIHNNLDSAIRAQRDKWDASDAEKASSDFHWPIPTYQAILLHIIFSILQEGGSLDVDLRFSLPAAKLELLTSLVRSCRRQGMFYYPNMLARYLEDDPSTFVWVCTEEIKRFNLALFRICAKLTGEGDGALFKAEELQFPLPRSCFLWHAVTQDQWKPAIQEGALDDLMNLSEDTWISNIAGLLNSLFGI